jgi:threonine aldolase
MRFLAAQVVALLDGDLWQRLALHANAMATDLALKAAEIDGIRITHAVQANAAFAQLDPAIADAARDPSRSTTGIRRVTGALTPS